MPPGPHGFRQHRQLQHAQRRSDGQRVGWREWYFCSPRGPAEAQKSTKLQLLVGAVPPACHQALDRPLASSKMLQSSIGRLSSSVARPQARHSFSLARSSSVAYRLRQRNATRYAGFCNANKAHHHVA
jgi:hypothetical protein